MFEKVEYFYILLPLKEQEYYYEFLNTNLMHKMELF